MLTWWNTHQLRRIGCISHRLDDGGREEGERVDGAKTREEDGHVHPDLPVAQRLQDILGLDLLGQAPRVLAQAALHLLPLGRAQEARVPPGVVVDAPVRAERDDEAREALEDEDPRPRGEAAGAAQLGDAAREDAAEGAGEGRGREEGGHADAALVAAVVLRDVVVDAREQAALEQAEEDARRHEARVALDEALPDHAGRPADHDEGDPDGRADALHHQVRGDLGRAGAMGGLFSSCSDLTFHVRR